MSKTIGVVLALKDKCSPQLKAIADKLGKSEVEARKLQKAIQKVSKEIGQGLKTAAQVSGVAIGSVVAGSTALIMKAGEVADRIDDMSNKIGISRQGFQEWDYLTKQNGANVESLQMGFKALTNQIVSANNGNKESVKMFKALGISVKDSSGRLKTQEEVFNEVVIALQKLPEGTQKAKYANTLLGRSGSELMPLFNATTEQLEKQREEYKKLGIEIADNAIDAGNKFGDSMEKLNSATASVTASLGAELLPVATDLLNTVITNMPQIKATVTPILQGIAGTIKFVVKNMDLLIAVGTGVVATFATFKTISTVISVMQTLTTAINLARKAQTLWNFAMMANPIGAVAVVVGTLVTGIILLGKNWDKVTAAAKKAFEIMLKIAKVTPIGAIVNAGVNIAKNIKGTKKNADGQSIGSVIKNNSIQKNAVGTTYSSGGLSIVGENGPELVSLPRGSSVASTEKTQKLMSGNNIIISVNIQGNMVGNNEFINQIADVFSMRLRTALQTV